MAVFNQQFLSATIHDHFYFFIFLKFQNITFNYKIITLFPKIYTLGMLLV